MKFLFFILLPFCNCALLFRKPITTSTATPLICEMLEEQKFNIRWSKNSLNIKFDKLKLYQMELVKTCLALRKIYIEILNDDNHIISAIIQHDDASDDYEEASYEYEDGYKVKEMESIKSEKLEEEPSVRCSCDSNNNGHSEIDVKIQSIQEINDFKTEKLKIDGNNHSNIYFVICCVVLFGLYFIVYYMIKCCRGE